MFNNQQQEEEKARFIARLIFYLLLFTGILIAAIFLAVYLVSRLRNMS